MARCDHVVRRVRTELRQGLLGGVGGRFLTVRQLAQRFGVSLTTAHKVVQQLKAEGLLMADSTNPARITAQAVHASELADPGAPRRLGLVVTNIASPFFSSLCRHVQKAGMDLGYQVLTASSDYQYQREMRTLEGFLEIGVEGLLICPGLADQCTTLYRDLLDRGVPTVFVSRRAPDLEADYVVAHNFVGAASVAGHLLNRGYHSFGYIAFGAGLKRDVRLSGYRSALAEEGFELNDDRIVSGERSGVQDGYRAMAQLVGAGKRPRAVMAYNDLLAIGALRYCQERDIPVPGEVAVAGFDNLPESRVTTPPLTTVDYGVESMARLAVQTLVGRIGNPRMPANRILLEPRLVVRTSTDPQARTANEPQEADHDQPSSIPLELHE